MRTRSFKDKMYYSKEYGVIHKVKKAYLALCSFIKWLCVFSTLLFIPVSIVGVVYNTFVCYDFFRVILYCIILYVMIDSNRKL